MNNKSIRSALHERLRQPGTVCQSTRPPNALTGAGPRPKRSAEEGGWRRKVNSQPRGGMFTWQASCARMETFGGKGGRNNTRHAPQKRKFLSRQQAKSKPLSYFLVDGW